MLSAKLPTEGVKDNDDFMDVFTLYYELSALSPPKFKITTYSFCSVAHTS